jgi:hypothetical protein
MENGHPLTSLRERAGHIWQRVRLRRREPWNWCLQTASLAVLLVGLVLHSPALLTLAALGLVAGCMELPLPPMEQTEFRRLLPAAERLIGLECAWLAKPMDSRKKRQVAFLALGSPVSAWLLWQQDFVPVGIAVMAAYLLYVRRKNIESGIKP